MIQEGLDLSENTVLNILGMKSKGSSCSLDICGFTSVATSIGSVEPLTAGSLAAGQANVSVSHTDRSLSTHNCCSVLLYAEAIQSHGEHGLLDCWVERKSQASMHCMHRCCNTPSAFDCAYKSSVKFCMSAADMASP